MLNSALQNIFLIRKNLAFSSSFFLTYYEQGVCLFEKMGLEVLPSYSCSPGVILLASAPNLSSEAISNYIIQI